MRELSLLRNYCYTHLQWRVGKNNDDDGNIGEMACACSKAQRDAFRLQEEEEGAKLPLISLSHRILQIYVVAARALSRCCPISYVST